MVVHDAKKPKLLEVSRQQRVSANCLAPPRLYLFSKFGQNIQRKMNRLIHPINQHLAQSFMSKQSLTLGGQGETKVPHAKDHPHENNI